MGDEPLAPGWYPAGRKYRFRFWDGQQWVPGTIKIKKTNHVLHAVLTVCTLGLWAPVWFLVAMRRDKNGMPVNSGGWLA